MGMFKRKHHQSGTVNPLPAPDAPPRASVSSMASTQLTHGQQHQVGVPPERIPSRQSRMSIGTMESGMTVTDGKRRSGGLFGFGRKKDKDKNDDVQEQQQQQQQQQAQGQRGSFSVNGRPTGPPPASYSQRPMSQMMAQNGRPGDFGPAPPGQHGRSQSLGAANALQQQPPPMQQAGGAESPTQSGSFGNGSKASPVGIDSNNPRWKEMFEPIVELISYQPHKTYVASPPELEMIFARTSAGQQPRQGPPGSPTNDWDAVWLQLSGTSLSMWSMKETRAAAAAGTKVPPTYFNITESTLELLSPLPPPPHRKNSHPHKFVFSLNTAGSNRLLFSCPTDRDLLRWTTGLRLAAWERSRLEEIYTGHLIRAGGREPPSPLSGGRFEGWVRVRVMGGIEWHRLWLVLSDPSAQPAEATGTQSRRRSIFGLGHQQHEQIQEPNTGVPMASFYNEPRTAKNRTSSLPVLTMTNVTQSYAMFPERLEVISQSNLMKVVGRISGDLVTIEGGLRESGWAMIMPEATEENPAPVPQTPLSVMMRWVTAFHDAFRLYGRPGPYSWNETDPRSLFFGYPRGEFRGDLFLTLDEAMRANYKLNTPSIRAQFAGLVKRKMGQSHRVDKINPGAIEEEDEDPKIKAEREYANQPPAQPLEEPPQEQQSFTLPPLQFSDESGVPGAQGAGAPGGQMSPESGGMSAGGMGAAAAGGAALAGAGLAAHHHHNQDPYDEDPRTLTPITESDASRQNSTARREPGAAVAGGPGAAGAFSGAPASRQAVTNPAYDPQATATKQAQPMQPPWGQQQQRRQQSLEQEAAAQRQTPEQPLEELQDTSGAREPNRDRMAIRTSVATFGENHLDENGPGLSATSTDNSFMPPTLHSTDSQPTVWSQSSGPTPRANTVDHSSATTPPPLNGTARGDLDGAGARNVPPGAAGAVARGVPVAAAGAAGAAAAAGMAGAGGRPVAEKSASMSSNQDLMSPSSQYASSPSSTYDTPVAGTPDATRGLAQPPVPPPAHQMSQYNQPAAPSPLATQPPAVPQFANMAQPGQPEKPAQSFVGQGGVPQAQTQPQAQSQAQPQASQGVPPAGAQSSHSGHSSGHGLGTGAALGAGAGAAAGAAGAAALANRHSPTNTDSSTLHAPRPKRSQQLSITDLREEPAAMYLMNMVDAPGGQSSDGVHAGAGAAGPAPGPAPAQLQKATSPTTTQQRMATSPTSMQQQTVASPTAMQQGVPPHMATSPNTTQQQMATSPTMQQGAQPQTARQQLAGTVAQQPPVGTSAVSPPIPSAPGAGAARGPAPAPAGMPPQQSAMRSAAPIATAAALGGAAGAVAASSRSPTSPTGTQPHSPRNAQSPTGTQTQRGAQSPLGVQQPPLSGHSPLSAGHQNLASSSPNSAAPPQPLPNMAGSMDQQHTPTAPTGPMGRRPSGARPPQNASMRSNSTASSSVERDTLGGGPGGGAREALRRGSATSGTAEDTIHEVVQSPAGVNNQPVPPPLNSSPPTTTKDVSQMPPHPSHDMNEAAAYLAYADKSPSPGRTTGADTSAPGASAVRSSFAPSKAAAERRAKAEAAAAEQQRTMNVPGAGRRQKGAQKPDDWDGSDEETDDEDETPAAVPAPERRGSRALPQLPGQQQQQQQPQHQQYPQQQQQYQQQYPQHQQYPQQQQQYPQQQQQQYQHSQHNGAGAYGDRHSGMPNMRNLSLNDRADTRSPPAPHRHLPQQPQKQHSTQTRDPDAPRERTGPLPAPPALKENVWNANFAVEHGMNEPRKGTFVELEEPQVALTKAFTPGGLIQAGMQDKQDRSAKRQEEVARETGSSLISVPEPPPPPQTGLVGAVAAHERDRKGAGGIGATLTDRDRERRLAEERQRKIDELQRQQMEHMYQGGGGGMYGGGGFPQFNPYGMPPMGGYPGYGGMMNPAAQQQAMMAAQMAYQQTMMAMSTAGSQAGDAPDGRHSPTASMRMSPPPFPPMGMPGYGPGGFMPSAPSMYGGFAGYGMPGMGPGSAWGGGGGYPQGGHGGHSPQGGHSYPGSERGDERQAS